tara:strand:- start:488 stop:2851 length:2364 start_codon:yes stop_codon:yes gene_type:complete
MDKNTGLYIVFAFLLLCILLSLDKKEGFATIDISSFESTCNSGGNVCVISTSGSRGYKCNDPTDDIPYYNITGDDSHSETFNISVSGGCSSIAYQTDPDISPSVSQCTHSGDTYNLSGCEPKCIRADSYDGYNLVDAPEYLEPNMDGYTVLENNMGLTDSSDGSRCSEGFYEAKNACFSRITGGLIDYSTPRECTQSRGIWYDGSGFPIAPRSARLQSSPSDTDEPLAGNKIKYSCPESGATYVVMGCEQGCLSRNTNIDEYTTIDGTDENKELIQILDRVDPDNSNSTIVKYPILGDSPYNMIETSESGEGLLNPSNFSVQGEPNSVEFKENISDEGEMSINIDFGGDVIVSPCQINNEQERKYKVSGLFPTCNDGNHECLNFNINYASVSEAPMNINEFKDSMAADAEYILGEGVSQSDILKYQNSIYYYRRYKDNDDKINIEGQIRCNDNPDSPFNCEIISSVFDPENPYYLANNEQLRQNCNDVCSSHGLICDSNFTYNDISDADLSDTSETGLNNRTNAIQDFIMNSNGWEDDYKWYQACPGRGCRGRARYGVADLSHTFGPRGYLSGETNVPPFITTMPDTPNIIRFGITNGYYSGATNTTDFQGQRPNLDTNIGDVCNYVIPEDPDGSIQNWISTNSRQVCKCIIRDEDSTGDAGGVVPAEAEVITEASFSNISFSLSDDYSQTCDEHCGAIGKECLNENYASEFAEPTTYRTGRGSIYPTECTRFTERRGNTGVYPVLPQYANGECYYKVDDTSTCGLNAGQGGFSSPGTRRICKCGTR